MSFWIPLANLNQEQVDLIGQHLSFQNKDHFFNAGAIQQIDFYDIDTDNNLHLPLFYAQKLLNRNHINYARQLKPVLNQPVKLDLQWRYWQPPIIQAAQERLAQVGACVLATPPGSGKTVMATYLGLIPYLNYFPKLVLILCPRRPLIKQWAETITKFTPFGFMVDTEAKRKFPQRLQQAMQRQPMMFIIYTPGKIDEIPSYILNLVGTVIVDEAHMICTKGAVHALLSTQPEHVILCSATPYRNNDGMEKMLHALAGQHTVAIAPLKPYKVFCIDTEWLYPEKKKFWNRRRVVDAIKLETRYLNSTRYVALLLYLARELTAVGRRIMIISRQTVLFDHLEKGLVANKLPFSRFYGKHDKFDEQAILLSTIGKGGTGFDENAYCENFSGVHINTIILASSIKFGGLLFQVIGRGLRGEDPWVIDVCHSNTSLEKHRAERCRLYKNTRGETVNWGMNMELLTYLEQYEI